MNKDKIYKARWRRKNREYIRAHAKEYRKQHGHVTRVKDLRIKYGITPNQYDEMMILQNGLCAICRKTAKENKKRLSIDHCHITKKVRGLLCYRCNTGLASFKDNLEILKQAVIYLEAIANAEGGK